MRQTNMMLGQHRIGRWSTIGRGVAAIVMAMLLFGTSTTPVKANIFGDLGNLYGCVVTWGQVCNMSHTVIGTGPAQSSSPIPVTCERPLLNGLPQFLTSPKGQAKYRFQGNCVSPAKPGAVMTVRWEGSWTPSETKTDRPNASETLEITGYEPFLPDRAPGGRIYMFFTARCTKDPWLQAQSTGKRSSGQISGTMLRLPNTNADSVTCTPFGGYVPDDLRQAIPNIDKQSFPRTGSIISPADKQRLSAEYERVNPSYLLKFGIEPRVSSNVLQAPISQSAAAVGKPNSQLKIFSRGTVSTEQAQPEGQVPSANITPSPGEGVDDSPELPQVAITFDRPLHFLSITGEDTLLAAGVYEIEPIQNLLLSLSMEGQETVSLPAIQGTHSEAIRQSVALLFQGESNDERHLVFLTPDGKRFDAVGSPSGIMSRGTGIAMVRPNQNLKAAVIQASAQPASGPPPPCQPNSFPVGPRWVPVPCSASVPNIPGGTPIPYLDGSNMLHACLNNNTGAFRIVRPSDACVPNGEVKVKWQLTGPP